MGLIVNGEDVDDALVQQEFEAVKSYESSRTHVSCCEKDAEFREKALEIRFRERPTLDERFQPVGQRVHSRGKEGVGHLKGAEKRQVDVLHGRLVRVGLLRIAQ